MSERDRLMRRIAAYDFGIVELHLFLDTHPNDRNAQKKLDEYTRKSDEVRREYEEKFGPIQATNMDANRWAWISNPWPWDTEEE
ncbi:MAG TPA: spore coat protein CotJB [Candidatus Gallacutalibacter stercoravium]|nr:spore coat protein CotJB [Candidatus Gallacutalibacter stercoravium]